MRVLVALGLLALGCRAEPDVPRLTISKETTLITEPLRDDGTPDYALWFNRKYGAGVTPENNAALPLLGAKLLRQSSDALAALGIDPAHPPESLEIVESPDQQAFLRQRRRAVTSRWRDEEAPLVAAWLEANARPHARVAEVVRSRTRYWLPMSKDFGPDTEAPSVLRLRELSELCWAAALRSGRGHEAAHRELATGFALAALLDQGSTVIERLLAVAMQGSGAEVAVVLANPPAGRAAARSLLDEMERLPASPPFREALENERLQTLAGYVDLYRSAARSKEAWAARSNEFASSANTVAAGLGSDGKSSWQHVPAWAIDWDELLRFAARCRMDAACADELNAAHSDLSQPVFAGLLAAARREPAARRRIARALYTDTPPFDYAPRFEDHFLRPWNESQALLRVARAAAAAALRRVEDGRYPRDAAALGAGLLAPHAGYVFAYSAVADGKGFTFSAVPEKPMQTGVRGFCGDSSGRFSQTRDGTSPAVGGGLCAPTPER
jgi:hypothetical protein